jgi:hypothetical protein
MFRSGHMLIFFKDADLEHHVRIYMMPRRLRLSSLLPGSRHLPSSQEVKARVRHKPLSLGPRD